MTLNGGPVPVTVTAHLSMANAPWLTEVFVHLEWAGLTTADWTTVTGSTTVPAHFIGQLAQALGDLTTRATADRDSEIAQHAARLLKEVA